MAASKVSNLALYAAAVFNGVNGFWRTGSNGIASYTQLDNAETFHRDVGHGADGGPKD
jgi:hypothetical protein